MVELPFEHGLKPPYHMGLGKHAKVVSIEFMKLLPNKCLPYVTWGMTGPIGGGARLDGPINII